MASGRRALRRRLWVGRRRDAPHPEVGEVDRELFEAVNDGPRTEADRVFVTVTELGSLYAAGAAGATLVALGRRSDGGRALAAAGATWIVLQGMKKVVDRPRPLDADPEGTRQLIARPHGHVVAVVASRRAHDLHAASPRGSSGSASLGRGALSALDATVAASRVYLGVHYPSDVISGLLIGRAVARLWPRRRVRSAGPLLGSPPDAAAPSPPLGWPVVDRFRIGSTSRSLRTVCSSPIGFMIGAWLFGRIAAGARGSMTRRSTRSCCGR